MTIPTNGSIYSLTASYMCKLCRNDSSACVKFEMGNVLLCEPLHIEYIGHNITANISSFMDKRLHHNGSFMPCKLWVFCSLWHLVWVTHIIYYYILPFRFSFMSGFCRNHTMCWFICYCPAFFLDVKPNKWNLPFWAFRLHANMIQFY